MHCFGAGVSVVERKDGEATASEKISLRSVKSARGDCCKHAGIFLSVPRPHFPLQQ